MAGLPAVEEEVVTAGDGAPPSLLRSTLTFLVGPFLLPPTEAHPAWSAVTSPRHRPASVMRMHADEPSFSLQRIGETQLGLVRRRGCGQHSQ